MRGEWFTFTSGYLVIAEKDAELYGEATAYQYLRAVSKLALNGEDWEFDESDKRLVEIWDRTKAIVQRQGRYDDEY